MNGGPWFVRRQFGYGYRPATWQGWVITVIAILAVVSTVTVTRIARAPIGIVFVVLILALFFGVAALTARRQTTAAATSDAIPVRESPASAPPRSAPRPEAAATRAVAQQSVTAAHATAEKRASASAPAHPGAPALVVEHLTKRFGQRTAFQDVSFTVGAAEVFGFLGPNGAGKTTTVRTLGTLIAPSDGSAVVSGIPLLPENGQAIRQHIAIMPEAPGLYLRLSVRENLEFFAGLFSVQNPRERIANALESVNMQSRSEDVCGSLSKGLRQRVGLARALLSNPDVLFLDEPTSGLDPVATRDVYELIAGLRRRGVTVFLTTHRLEEAERLCDRVAILNTTLRMVGRPAELRAMLFHKSLVVATAAPLPSPNVVFGSIRGIESWSARDTAQTEGSAQYELTVSDPKTVAPSLTRALVAAGADVESIAERQHSLEDVYLELISEDVEADRR